ncbi:MAG: GCN5-related N-acetyltransferase [Clostridia bacterium]|jgi:RimJ/RimL family protein N-acetyltransferase|nr:GCN5-related N-acetyltransferase [Clostridia bacterium]
MFWGDRINLRQQKKEDAELIAKYQQDADVMENYFMSYSIPPIKEFIERWYDHTAMDKEGYGFAIENKQGEFIGSCHTMGLNLRNGTTYIAIFIGHPEYRSKGYGTEAMKLLLNFLFNEVGLRKVKLNVFSFNKRAIRCYEKSGFKLEGINKKEIYRYGEYHDNYAMAAIRDDFNRGVAHV